MNIFKRLISCVNLGIMTIALYYLSSAAYYSFVGGRYITFSMIMLLVVGQGIVFCFYLLKVIKTVKGERIKSLTPKKMETE